MNCLGNIVWLIFGGFLSGMGYIIGGLLTCLTMDSASELGTGKPLQR